MAAILRNVIVGYNFLFDEIADSRTKEWFLVAKPYQGLTILAVYLLFVFKWGPKFMTNRRAYNLDRIMIIYNAIQIICCGYIFNFAFHLWTMEYQWFCEPVDRSETEHATSIATVVYYYYLLKILDLFDTIFFVLRKKFNQVSFLHVYHHTGMVMLIWGSVTYLPGGHGTFVGLINSFVHVVMYSYYLLSVAVPEMKDSIWVKKRVTQIQIIQFFLCVVHMGSLVFIPDCAYPRWTAALFLPQNLFMLILFLDFYIKTYIKNPKKIAPVKKTEKVTNEIEDHDLDSKEIKGNIQNIVEASHTTNSELLLRNIKRC